MKTLLKITFLLFLSIGCTKPKEETCVAVTLNNNVVYLEKIGTFKDQSAIDTYPHLADTRPGDIMYKDRNADGVINEGDHCN